MASQEEVICFTDGSCISNGSPNCKCSSAVVFPNGEIPDQAFYLPRDSPRSNNRAEYFAAIKAMELTNDLDPSGHKILHIFTDSQLLINTCTKWMQSWEQNGWKKKTPGEIKNLDMVMILYEFCEVRTVKWTHVKAHTGKSDFNSIWNDKVDHLAQSVVEGDDISGIFKTKPKSKRNFFK